MAKLVGVNAEEKIWNYLIAAGYTPAGAAGIMGNLDAESGLSTNNLENYYNKTLGSDTYYTSCVNDKSYTKNQFVNDKAGYGLAQWTYHTRKKGLYEITIERGLSIDDLGGQLDFLIKELKGYSSLNKLLKSTNSVTDASDRVLKEFERPAVLNYDARRERSQKFYDKYANVKTEVEKEEVVVKESNTDESGTTTTKKFRFYTVKQGDSWWKIAENEMGSGTKMVELAEFNGKTTDDILHAKDKIKIPVEETSTTVKVVGTATTKKKYTIYTVKQGDSWWKIAETKMGSGNRMDELAKFNGKTTKSILHANDKIKIPVDTKTSTKKKYTTYTVKKGDSWSKIASNEMGSASKMYELAEFNGMTVKTIIHPAQVLKIPK